MVLRLFAISMAILSFIGSPAFAQSELPPATTDGRFGTKCQPWSDGHELCRISFYRLLAEAPVERMLRQRILEAPGTRIDTVRVQLDPSWHLKGDAPRSSCCPCDRDGHCDAP